MRPSRGPMTQVLAISLFLIVLAGVAWRIAGSEATNNVAALVSAVVAVAASIVGLRRPSQAQAEIETVASLLAGAVRKQWEEVRAGRAE